MFAAGWLEAGGPRTACAFPARACGYPVGYFAVTPFLIYTSWSPVLVYADTGFSNLSLPRWLPLPFRSWDRVPPPVFELPSVTSTEAFGWKH